MSHEAVETVFREIYTFGGSAGSTGLDEDDTSIAGILEPRHGQIRRIINAVVAFHKSQQIEPFLVELSQRLVDEFAAAASAAAGPEGADVMPIAVDPVPPNAMARLLGFPEADAARYYAWADQVGAAFAAAAAEGRSISMAEAVPEFTQYVDDRIAERLAMPEADWPQDAPHALPHDRDRRRAALASRHPGADPLHDRCRLGDDAQPHRERAVPPRARSRAVRDACAPTDR